MQVNDALDLGDDYEEDEEDGIAGNERESNTAGKSPNPYQLAGRDISG